MDPIEPLLDANPLHDDLNWLIQQANQGDQQALGELIRLLLPMAYRYLAWLTGDPEAARQAAPLGLLLIGQRLHKADRARSAEQWLAFQFNQVFQPPAQPRHGELQPELAALLKLAEEQRRLLGAVSGAGFGDKTAAAVNRKTEAEFETEIELAFSILADGQPQPGEQILKQIQREIEKETWSSVEFAEIANELTSALLARQSSQRFLAKFSEYAWVLILLLILGAVFAGFRFFSSRDAYEAGWRSTPTFEGAALFVTATLQPGVFYDTFDVKEDIPLREIALSLAIPIQSLSILNGYAPDEIVPAGVRLKLPAPYSPGIPVPTPVTPPAPAPALDSNAELAAIVSRMQSSRSHWRTLWLDGIVIVYGPPEYVGEPFVQREQVWISEPSYALYLQSDYQGGLTKALIKNSTRLAALDVLSGERKFFPPEQVYYSSSFVNLIYPLNMYGSVPLDAFKLEGEDNVAGRRCLILSLSGGYSLGYYGLSYPESLTRLCIDAETGVILRSELVRQVDGLPIQTIEVRRIVYNQNFPPQLFDLYENTPQGFAVDEQNSPETPENALPQVQLVRHPARELPELIDPPAGFDASQSRLEIKITSIEAPFYENAIGAMTYAVFTEGYYLGTLGEASTGIAACERSPDGRYLAYTTYLIRNATDLPNINFTVLDLADFSTAYLNGPPLSIFAYDFSPDSRKLAMTACPELVDATPICDLIVLDLDTGLDTLLVEDMLARRVTWSPDGQYLAFDGYGFGVDANTASGSDFFVIQAETGELVYRGRIDQSTGEAPQDSPAAGWYDAFSEEFSAGIDRCMAP